MDLVDEQNIARIEIGEDRRQIARLGEDGSRGHAEVHTQLAADDLRERRLAEAWWTVEQGVIHRLAPPPGALYKDGKIGARLLLPHELRQGLRAESTVIVLDQTIGAECWIGISHAFSPNCLV